MTTIQSKIKISLVGLCLSALGLLLFTSGCAEVAGSGAFVNIPVVGVQCTTGACNVNTSKIAYVVYTTSGCNAPDFGAVASGSATVTCTNPGGCNGTISQFVDSNTTVTSIREGFYSVCVTIDVDGLWTGFPASGDMQGVLDTRITGGSIQQTVINFTAKP